MKPPANNLLLTMTYIVVIFSILVQGVTIKNVVKKAMAKEVEF